MSENATKDKTEETYIRIPACVTNFANKPAKYFLPKVITGHLPAQVSEAKMKVAIPVASAICYLGYRMLCKLFGKTDKAPKA